MAPGTSAGSQEAPGFDAPEGPALLRAVRWVVLGRLKLGRPVCVGSVARAVYMSVRTLQRRLGEAGSSVTSLLDEVRFEEAVRGVACSEDPLKAVAFDLGYAEPASFTKAFRRWSGLSPREYRARVRPGGATPAAANARGGPAPPVSASPMGAWPETGLPLDPLEQARLSSS